MASLRKTSEAEQDLTEIWLYTAETWGKKQADMYLHAIEKCFEKINRGDAVLKHLAKSVHSIRCNHHYIFVLMDKNPIVIAILHEKMDLIARLKKRLI